MGCKERSEDAETVGGRVVRCLGAVMAPPQGPHSGSVPRQRFDGRWERRKG